MNSKKNKLAITLLLLVTWLMGCSNDDGPTVQPSNEFLTYNVTIDGVDYSGIVPKDSGSSFYSDFADPPGITLFFSSESDAFYFAGAFPFDDDNNPMPLGNTGDDSSISFTFNPDQPSELYAYESTDVGTLTIENLQLSDIPGSDGIGQWAKFTLTFSGVFRNTFDESTLPVSGTVQVTGDYF